MGENMNDTKSFLLSDAIDYCSKQVPFLPRLGFVLGSGLDAFIHKIEIEKSIDFQDIPGFPVPTTENHKGCFLFGHYAEVPVVIMQGRLHYYEGFSPAETILPIRLLKHFGVQHLLLTNASGAIRTDLAPGDFLLITDHLSFLVPSPLRGPNDNNIGKRFPDMGQPYDPALNHLLMQAAQECSIPLQSGTYIQAAGPQFETPAEIQCFQKFGADAVGMSTVNEVIAANHCGIRVACISCIGNMAAGIASTPITLEQVIEASKKMSPKLEKLLFCFIQKYAEWSA